MSESSYVIAVVESEEGLRRGLVSEVESLAPTRDLASLEEMDAVQPGQPTVLVLGPTLSANGGLERAGAMVQARSTLSLIAVPKSLTTGWMRTALQMGVADVVSLKEEPSDLRDSIARTAEALVNRIGAQAANVAAPNDGEPGCLITVFSTKGGVGKSVVAVNLAAALAQRSSGPVAIVDADLQFGDVCLMLDLAPRHTVVDALEAGDDLDAGLLGTLLTVHRGSGLRVLPAPLEPGFADQSDWAGMSRIIQLLRVMCSHVVVDTCNAFNEVVLGLLDNSDEIVVVAGMDVPSIKNVKVGVQTLRLLNVSATKVKLVLNRANSKVGLDVADVERTLQLKADIALPSDIIVPQSVNRGVPVIIGSPRSKVSRGLEQLAAAVMAARPDRKEGRSRR